MALQDLAQRSGFTHAVNNVVFLQLELPDSHPELRELFSCQLELDDFPITPAEENEWRKSELATRLYERPGAERGTIGTVTIKAFDRRNVTSDPDQPHKRLLTLFGQEMLLKNIRHDGWYRYGYGFNARVRCLSVERQRGRIWLVRGEILSGGLIFGDPRVIDDADRQRIWPNETLRGMFFTGSELHLESGEKIEKLSISNAFLPFQSGNLPLDKVRINQPAQAGKYLFHAHRPGETWRAWKTIKSWDGTLLTLDVPYTSQTKPGQSWHYEIYRIKSIKRYRLAGVKKNWETTEVERAVWEQIPATGSISQLFIQDPHGPLFEPSGLPIQSPAEVANDMLNKVQSLCDSSRLKIEPASTQEPTTSRPIVIIEEMDQVDLQGKPASKKSELLRVDWRVTVVGTPGTSAGFPSEVVWQPRTLKITTDPKYLLLDSDVLETELRGEEIPTSEARVKFNWTGAGAITPTIPITRLVGTSLDTARQRSDSRGNLRELWFQANCGSNIPYTGVPLAWANISAEVPPAVPIGDGARASRLSDSITFTTGGWTIQAVPADSEAGRATVPPGVQLTLKADKTATLELFAADVTLDSPVFPIYREPLNDPKSVPNERRPDDSAKTDKGSLRFIHRPEWERVPPENDNAVVCKHETDKFVLRRSPQAVRLYLPAERALIDPVSVTRGNLVGRQIVAFPLLVVSLKVTDVRIVEDKDKKTLEAHIDLEATGGNPDGIFQSITDHTGFFAQFELAPDEVARPVLRIRRLDGSESTRTLVAPVQADQLLPTIDKVYHLTIGPTRLALPRDVNHGLIPIGVTEFWIEPTSGLPPILKFNAASVRGEEGQSVLSLHPWSEWGPKPEASADPKRPWLTTGRVRLHHRNLIQEHAEFESSFEDRFPPEGPAKNPDGTIPSPLLPLADFVQAVRDRYTEATGNLIAPSGALPAKGVRNWLPKSKLTDDVGQTLNPQVEIALNANDLTVLPEAKVKTELGIADDPFSYKAKVNGTEQHFYQSLKLRKTTEPGADQHWLDVSVCPTKLEIAKKPELRLAKTDPTDVTSRRAVDSSVPLLFSRHDIDALAAVGVDNGRTIAVVGSPEQPANVYLFDERGAIIGSKQSFPNGPLVDVVMLHHNTTIRGLAIRKNGANPELVRFTVDQSTGTPTVHPTAVSLTGTPVALACTPQDPDASIFVLTTKPGVFVVHAETGANSEIPGVGTGPKAIGVDLVDSRRYVAIGYEDGHISVRADTSPTWPEIVPGEKRQGIDPILGGPKSGVDTLDARPIRSLRVHGHPSCPIVLAVDGTRFPCVWGTDSNDGTSARVWLQQSDALSVAFGRLQDLEQRPRFKITDDVITKLSQSGVPAEAIDALRSIKDKEFPSRTEFENKLRELLEAAHQVHLQTILDHARIDSTVPLFALGLRTGTVRLSAPIGRSEGLADIRQFDAAEAPVTRLALAGGGTAATPAVCFAGTSAGGLLAWDTRRGLEWSEAERVAPTTYLDALGVVRTIPSVAPSADWTVDELSLGIDKYYSVTTRSLDLVVDDPSGLAAEDITDIRLWADAFKVRADGTVEPRQFPDGPFDPGHIAFFSNITASDKLTSLAALNHVPRLGGIPFFVTGVQKLNLSNDHSSVDSAVVEGVLINPDEVAAGQDPADAGTLSGIVVRALSRCKPMVVRIESGAWSIVESKIDWTFAVNRQEPVGDSKNFPGKIARIVGTVSKTVVDGRGRLSIMVDGAKSQALVFGRLWPFSESVTTVSHAAFERASNDRPWLQTQFSFESEGNDAASVTIMSNENEKLGPVASLGIDFGNVSIGGASLSGRLEVERRVQFNLGEDDAHAQIEQGGYRCLLLDPTKRDNAGRVTRGEKALVLWTAGNLGSVEADDAVGPLKLCAALVEMKVDSTIQSGWKVKAGTSPNQVEGTCSAEVHQSLLTVTVNDNGTPKLVAQHGTVLIQATLRNQQAATFLLEGNVQSTTDALTGMLILKDSSRAVQATIRVKLDLNNTRLELTDDVFWATFVTPDTTFLEPEISMPRPPSVAESKPFSVNSFKAASSLPFGFVRIGLKKVGNEFALDTRLVEPSRIPLLPELEPSLVQAPERIGSNEVRLSHRLRAGLALRPNAPLDRFRVVLNESTSGEPRLPTTTDQSLLLETVVSMAGPLLRLRPEGWLVPPPNASTDTYRTDGLFVLNVDFRRDDIPVVAAIEARSRKFDPSEPDTDPERDRYRELLRAAGAQGVAISYHVTDEATADLGFVDSPFYAHSGDVWPDRTGAVRGGNLLFAAGAVMMAASAPTSAWLYGFDPRLRLPDALNDRTVDVVPSRYVAADLPIDPYADVCCLAHRQYRLERRRSTRDPEVFDNADSATTPILHNAEVPAFLQPARLSFPLTGRWLRTRVEDKSPIATSRPFFPPRIDWELAADKPGAMFQSLVQARVTNRDGASRREPPLDFALREPQFVRLANCVTAEVNWQKTETTISNPVNGYAGVNLVWTEVIGSVQVANAETNTEKFNWLKPSAAGITLSRTPLQLVIDFNSEVFLVNQADAAVPAYRVEAQPDEGVPPVKVRPAASYLVANPDIETVFAPQTVADEGNDCTLASDSDGWKATVSGVSIQSGTSFTLTDFSSAELNNVAHRFVDASGGATFILMQDTAPDDSVPNNFSIKVEGNDYTATIRCRRPLCVDVTGLDGAPKNDLNGKSATSTELSGKLRQLRDGADAIELRLAQVVPNDKQYLIVTPSQLPSAGSGKCRVVTTQADGFLEAAVRMPAEVAADSAKAWTPALTLTAPALDDLKPVGEHKLIRLDCRSPAANGVFGVLGNDKLLARPVAGNGRTNSGGKARILGGSSVDLANVEGVTPIILTLATHPGWNEGTTVVVVSDVRDVPQANGSWVVQKLSDDESGRKRFALFEPTVAELQTSTPIPAVASAVIPLREAFPPSADLGPRLRCLNLEPKWEAEDRPLLQVHWAGAAQFKNEDGKGIAWRPGGVIVGLYEQIKQVKFLANSQLSPKLAFVMTSPAGTSWQRTILFGDAAPPFKAKPLLEVRNSNGEVSTHFRLVVPDNRESLSISIPQVENGSFILHLVKSLPSGVAVYDQIAKSPS